MRCGESLGIRALSSISSLSKDFTDFQDFMDNFLCSSNHRPIFLVLWWITVIHCWEMRVVIGNPSNILNRQEENLVFMRPCSFSLPRNQPHSPNIAVRWAVPGKLSILRIIPAKWTENHADLVVCYGRICQLRMWTFSVDR